MREKEYFREQLAFISEQYPGKAMLTVTEAARVLGLERRAVVNLIERKKLPAINVCKGNKNKSYMITISAVARLSAGE